MTDDLSFQHDTLLLDACCVITLSASGIFEELLRLLPVKVGVADYVVDQEALWHYDGPPNDMRAEQRTINLQPMIDRGLIDKVTLETEEEQLTFLAYSTILDDGEAMTGAIAFHRSYSIATDEKKGLRIFSEDMPGIQLITTPELLRYWAEETRAEFNLVCEVIQNTRYKGVYMTPRGHALLDWWEVHMG